MNRLEAVEKKNHLKLQSTARTSLCSNKSDKMNFFKLRFGTHLKSDDIMDF